MAGWTSDWCMWTRAKSQRLYAIVRCARHRLPYAEGEIADCSLVFLSLVLTRRASRRSTPSVYCLARLLEPYMPHSIAAHKRRPDSVHMSESCSTKSISRPGFCLVATLATVHFPEAPATGTSRKLMGLRHSFQILLRPPGRSAKSFPRAIFVHRLGRSKLSKSSAPSIASAPPFRIVPRSPNSETESSRCISTFLVFDTT